jgi:hypothetical protein
VKALLKRFGFLGGSIAMVMLVPMLTNFLTNKSEVAVQDLILPVLFDLLVAGVVTGLFWRFYRRNELMGYTAAVLFALTIGTGYESRFGQAYNWISALLPIPVPDSVKGPLFSLIFLLIIFVLSKIGAAAIARFVGRKSWRQRDVMRAITITITITFVFQAVPAIFTIAQSWPQYFYRPPALAAQTTVTPGSAKPDIYYIVLDRYASQSVLKDQFGFDNSDFINFLSDNGYYTNPKAHQNYPYTAMSIASTMNAGYNTDLVNQFGKSASQTAVPYQLAIQYSSVAQRLKSLGYTYDEIGNWYEASDQAPLADHFYLKDGQLTLLGHTMSINNFTKNEIQQGPLWRFIQASVSVGRFKVAGYSTQGQVEMTQYALNTLQTLTAQSSGGRFIFAHLLIPHDPYYFNADGSVSTTPNGDNIGEPIKQKYVGQVKYINDQMKSLLGTINSNSHGQAIVILQSDEGPYPMQLNDNLADQTTIDSELNDLDMRTWSDTNLAMKFGNLAAYHIPAAAPDALANGANNADVFRVVLNSYFGAKLPYQTECYYAYPDGRHHPFLYSDITRRLDPSGSTACSANGGSL